MKRMDFEGQEVAGVARVIHEKDKATCIDSIIWLTHMVELGVSVNLMKAILTFKASAEKNYAYQKRPENYFWVISKQRTKCIDFCSNKWFCSIVGAF